MYTDFCANYSYEYVFIDKKTHKNNKHKKQI